MEKKREVVIGGIVLGMLLIFASITIALAEFQDKENEEYQQAALLSTSTATLPKPTVPFGAKTSTPTLIPTITPRPLPTEFIQLDTENVFATPTPLPDVSTYRNQANFTFKEMGILPFVMYYPEVRTFDIDLPDRWLISPSSSTLELHYSFYEYEMDKATAIAQGLVSSYNRYLYHPGIDRPFVEVFIDNYFAGSFTPEIGEDKLFKVKLPFGLVEDRKYNAANTHTIYIYYYRGSDIFCDYNGVLAVKDTSRLVLNFQDALPQENLAALITQYQFPHPLLQNSFLPETLYFILPDNPTELDLTIAAKVAAVIGRNSPFVNIKIQLLTGNQVSESMLINTGAVVIGSPQQNSFLRGLYQNKGLLTELTADGTRIAGITDEEGVLQIVRSYINNRVAFLVVAANTPQGLARAGDALAHPPIVGLSGKLFIAKAAYPQVIASEQNKGIFRFSDLNFRELVVYGRTQQSRNLIFYVPRDWVLQDDVKVIINYANSANLSYINSSITVLVNGSPISTLMLDEKPGEKQITIPIPKENIRVGTLNIIRFDVILDKELDCALYQPLASWVTIRDSSLLYLPYEINTELDKIPPIPNPIFYLGYEQNPVVFILPDQPTVDEVNGMINMARLLGSFMQRPEINFEVKINPPFDPNLFSGKNLALIGLPTRNSILASINDQLLQPFVPGENNLTLKEQLGQYRIEQGISLGLVQVIPAPWDKLRGITVISGTSDEGLRWAFDRISLPDSGYNFNGALAFISNRIEVFEQNIPQQINLAALISEVSGTKAVVKPVEPTQPATQEATPVMDQYVPKPKSEEPVLGTYLIIGIVVVGLLVAAISIIRTARGGRKP